MKTHTKHPPQLKKCLSELNHRLDRVEKSVDEFEDELERLWDRTVLARSRGSLPSQNLPKGSE